MLCLTRNSEILYGFLGNQERSLQLSIFMLTNTFVSATNLREKSFLFQRLSSLDFSFSYLSEDLGERGKKWLMPISTICLLVPYSLVEVCQEFPT